MPSEAVKGMRTVERANYSIALSMSTREGGPCLEKQEIWLGIYLWQLRLDLILNPNPLIN